MVFPAPAERRNDFASNPDLRLTFMTNRSHCRTSDQKGMELITKVDSIVVRRRKDVGGSMTGWPRNLRGSDGLVLGAWPKDQGPSSSLSPASWRCRGPWLPAQSD